MIGITSCGGFVPRFRLPRQTIFQAMGWYNAATFGVARGEKAVANYDEDSLTMAVSAAIDCLKGGRREKVVALFLGSTTLPYLQRESAGIMVAALDLPQSTRTTDVTDSTKAGTTALLAGLDAVQAGIEGQILVAAADCRVARMGSVQEHNYGDGAAALLLGSDRVIAEFKGAHSTSTDIGDTVRESGQRFDRSWEERWIRDVGYQSVIPQTVLGLLEKTGAKLEDVAKVLLPCSGRVLKGLARKLGLQEEQCMDPLMGVAGDLGAAHPLAMLSIALQSAKPGDQIIVVGYGQGADAILLQATEAVTEFASTIDTPNGPKGIGGHLEHREDIQSYERYAVFRELIPTERGIRGEFEAPTAFSTLWRDRRGVMGLVGSKCTACGTPQYPAQRICVKCGAVDEMEHYRFSDKKGNVFTYTGDMLAFSVDPPAIYGIVDINEGGRLYLDFTDCALEDLKVDMPVELSFRRKYHDPHRGISGYFWKAVPVRT